MEKKITITVTAERHHISIDNIDEVEAFGLLAFYKEKILDLALKKTKTKRKTKN